MTDQQPPRRRRTVVPPETRPTVEQGVEFRVGGKPVAEVHQVRDPANPERPNMARVRVGGSSTVKLQDMNFVRCEVSVEMPCEPNEAAVRSTYAQLSTLVDDLLNDELDKATAPPSAG